MNPPVTLPQVAELAARLPSEERRDLAVRILDELATSSPKAPTPGPGPTMLETLDRIHRDQQRRGRRPMTEEEMAAEMARDRADDAAYEQRWRQIWSQTSATDKADE